MPNIAPYGAWKSPISAEMLATGGVRLAELAVDGDDVYWIESRPSEGGRSVIMRRDAQGEISDAIGQNLNARNAVHEYGGGSYAVHDGTVYFTNWEDQRIYSQRQGEAAAALTPEPDIPRGLRYADLSVTRDGKYLLCVRETHFDNGDEARNEVVRVDTASGEVSVMATGEDFYSSPRACAAHDGVAWLTWGHPNMPWDESELMSGSLSPYSDELAITTAAHLAGGDNVSITQPRWSPDGILHWVSDASGWWRLCAWRDGSQQEVLASDFDVAGPDWQFGFSAYAFLSDGRTVIARGGASSGKLILIEPGARSTREVEVPYTELAYLTASRDSDVVYFVGASPTASNAVVRCDLVTGECSELLRSMPDGLDAAYISTPRPIVFPTTDDAEAHAWYYPPTNPEHAAPSGTKPPLMVVCHGGPTSRSGTGFDPKLQYWTSRGFALVDVNYRGSSGYGRAYRDALKTKWGVYDTDDCIAAARYLKDMGDVDPDRVVIRGGSAGGYTTINALTFHDEFAAGAAYYGIADLSVFIGDTHKFESRYLDSLVGPYPEQAQRYHDRSAINFIDQLSTPMIILQGLEDEIVPPSQAELMVEALESKGIPHANIGFPGEQHGFRVAANIVRAQEAELYFYGKVLGFTPADDIGDDVVEVKNLD